MRYSYHRPILLALLAGLGLCLWAGVTSAATFHVSPFGSNTPPYDTYAKAAHNIQDAVNQAGKGDTVLVGAGEYHPDTTIFLKDSLFLVGVGMDSVTVIAPWSVGPKAISCIEMYDWCRVHGLKFLSDWGSVNIGLSFLNNRRGPVLVNECYFLGFLYAIESAIASSDTLWVHGCVFEGRPLGGNYGVASIFSEGTTIVNNDLFVGDGFGIWSTGSGRMDVRENVFKMSDDPGSSQTIHADINPDSMRIYNNLFLSGAFTVFVSGSRVAFRNNTVLKTTHRWGALGGGIDHDLSVAVRNNVFVHQTYPCHFADYTYSRPPGGIVFNYNAFWPPLDPPVTVEGQAYIDSLYGTVYANPMFTSDSTYRLQKYSPLIDAGDPSILDPDGSRSDIGRWGGPAGVSYAYPEEAPAPPESLSADLADTLVSLHWKANTEADLAGYEVHRSAESAFVPTPLTLRTTIPAAQVTFADTVTDTVHGAHFKVVTFDSAGLRGGPSNEVAVIPTGIVDTTGTEIPLPLTPFIRRAYPNPFNASVVIDYVLPAIGPRPTAVAVMVYDALGGRVAQIDAGWQDPGWHSVQWNATDNKGRALASGVYLARLKVWDHEFGPAQKLVLSK